MALRPRSTPRRRAALALTVAPWAFACFLPVAAAVSYSISDGIAELTLSIDPGEDIVFLNTFPAAAAGQYIDQVKVAYGRVGGPSVLDGLPVTILLYEDANGGSPQDATLLWTLDTTIANGNTNFLNVYAFPRVRVTTTLVVGFYYRNATGAPVFIGSLDRTNPIFAARSYAGFAAAIDPAHLENIPVGQFDAQEGLGVTGNYRIEARGQATDGIVLTAQSRPDLGAVRLTWTGVQASFVLERASTPDFVDAQTIGSGAITTIDDPVLDDGMTWYYRVR